MEYIREELTELFRPHDPEHVHEHIEPTEMADDPRRLEAALHPLGPVQEAGPARSSRRRASSAEHTHYDVPKPRTSFPVGHLTTGIAFAFPWHRDVWYSAPAQQINWWLPVFPVREDNAMSFDLAQLRPGRAEQLGPFDYYRNNAAA